MRSREIRKLHFKSESITSKGSGKMNEDAVLKVPTLGVFGIFDGATSLSPYTDSKGRTGGYIAADTARESFGSCTPPFEQMLSTANDAIYEYMRRAGVDTSDKVNLWATSAAVVRLHNDSFEWICVSDSLVLTINNDGTHRILPNSYDHDSEVLSLMKKLAREGDPNPRLHVIKELRDLRRQMNKTYGFIAGEHTVEFIFDGKESLENVSDILIFSDGMFPPKANPLDEIDTEAIVREYKKGGLKGWLDYVRKIEDTDPDLLKYPRFKQHDDASAIAISFEGSSL